MLEAYGVYKLRLFGVNKNIGHYPTRIFFYAKARRRSSPQQSFKIPLFASINRPYHQNIKTVRDAGLDKMCIDYYFGYTLYDPEIELLDVFARIDETASGQIMVSSLSCQEHYARPFPKVCATATATSTISKDDAQRKAEDQARKLAVQKFIAMNLPLEKVYYLQTPQEVTVTCPAKQGEPEVVVKVPVVVAAVDDPEVPVDVQLLNHLNDMERYLDMVNWSCPGSGYSQ